MIDVEYNIDETKKVFAWRHVKAVLRLGRLLLALCDAQQGIEADDQHKTCVLNDTKRKRF